MTINWKKESTWTAIGSGVITVLAATGLLTADESAAATAVVASLASGIVGLVILVRSVRNRIRADREAKAAEAKAAEAKAAGDK